MIGIKFQKNKNKDLNQYLTFIHKQKEFGKHYLQKVMEF